MTLTRVSNFVVQSPGPRTSKRRGFTLVEVLVTLMFMALVLPAIMEGISLAGSTASDARRRTEASTLAASKLSEIVAGNLWTTASLSGNFEPDYPDYNWQAQTQPWSGDTSGAGLQEIDLTVSWIARGKQQSLSVSTLVYSRNTSTTNTQ